MTVIIGMVWKVKYCLPINFFLIDFDLKIIYASLCLLLMVYWWFIQKEEKAPRCMQAVLCHWTLHRYIWYFEKSSRYWCCVLYFEFDMLYVIYLFNHLNVIQMYIICCWIYLLVLTTLHRNWGFHFKTFVWSAHYSDVIMGAMASQITSLTITYSTVYSGTDQRKHQSSATLAFARGIHRWPVNSPHKWPVTQKLFLYHDVIMNMSMTPLMGPTSTTFLIADQYLCNKCQVSSDLSSSRSHKQDV